MQACNSNPIKLPPASAVGVIESVLFVCLCIWVCETYVVHHFVGTGLCCAPPTCIVHHWPAFSLLDRLLKYHFQAAVQETALCTMVHKRDLRPWEVGPMVWRPDVMWHQADIWHHKMASLGRKNLKMSDAGGVWMLRHFHFGNSLGLSAREMENYVRSRRGPDLVELWASKQLIKLADHSFPFCQ